MPISFKSLSGNSVNDFVLNVGNAQYNTYELPDLAQAGGYTIGLGTPDSTLDFYLLSATSSLVGYTNSTAVVATEPFNQIVVMGAASSQKISFVYNGPSANALNSGLRSSAGAYINSISQNSLPNVNSSTTVYGGNFASDVGVFFIGTDSTERSAKSIVVTSTTQLEVVRPDSLPTSFSPYSLKVVNPGVQIPSGSSSHILVNAINSGSTPSWTSPQSLTSYTIGTPYSLQLLVADGTDGQVNSFSIISGLLPAGLSLNSSTGIISGTSSVQGKAVFSIRATDLGGNMVEKAFDLSHAPTFTDSTLGTVLKDFPYSDSVAATDPTATVPTYSIVSGSLPSGLSLSSSGIISGTATTAGSYNITIRASVLNYGYLDLNKTLIVSNSATATFTSTGSWTAPAGVTNVTALILAGGGGGGTSGADYQYVTAGGGAGGLRIISMSVVPGNSYTATVGAGGSTGQSSATVGSNSSFNGQTSIGGGNGGALFNGSPGSGGSGGGASRGNGAGGAGTAGQGYKGGDSPADRQPGSGGGAGGQGSTGSPSASGGPGVSGLAQGGWAANGYSAGANTGSGGGGSGDFGTGGNGGSGLIKLAWAI